MLFTPSGITKSGGLDPGYGISLALRQLWGSRPAHRRCAVCGIRANPPAQVERHAAPAESPSHLRGRHATEGIGAVHRDEQSG
eukprot:gene6460-4652_t